jgi:tight adherence protein C
MKLTELLPGFMNVDNIVTVMAGLSALAAVAGAWYGLVDNNSATRRARELAASRDALRAGLAGTRKRHNSRQVSVGLMRRVVNRISVRRGQQADRLARNLAQAGFRSRDAVVTFQFAKIATPVALGLSAVVFLYGFNFYDLSGPLRALLCAVSLAVGYVLPDLYVKNATDKRRAVIRKALPDALDLMVICTEAGLSLDATLKRVSEEFGHACGPLADELGLTALEIGFLPDRRQALRNLDLRTNIPAIRAMVNNLLQADKYGTPLAQALRVLSAEFREERMLKAEEKAARLPAMLTVPMIIFILPPLFVVLLGPAVLRTIDALRHL